MNYFIEFDLLYIPDDISKHPHGRCPSWEFQSAIGHT